MTYPNLALTLPESFHTGLDEDAQPTLLRYDDGYNYQNILAPLVSCPSDDSADDSNTIVLPM